MEKFAIPEGMRDLILGECKAKKSLQKDIEEVFDSYGYEEIITPAIEYYQTYLTGFENVKDELMYKFFDHNNRILTLRMDMTVPIARVVATKFKDLNPPLRFRYCANVFKVKQSFAGKRNEVSDCGIELIGQDASSSDLEILVMALEVMEKMKQPFYTLEIGNVQFFHVACKALNLNEDEIEILADLIDRKSLIELEQYLSQTKFNDKQKEFFMQLPWLCGDHKILQEARAYCFNSELTNVVDTLNILYEQLKALGYGNKINFDLGKVPHLNYYSGLIFEGFVEGIGSSVLSGGRYDSLLAKFGRNLPAIGFSVKLDYVLDILNKDTLTKSMKIIRYPFELKVQAIQEAKKLRQNYRVQMLQDDTLKDMIIEEVAS